MSGACAGVLSEVRSLAQLHFELAEANMPQGIPFMGPIRGLHKQVGGIGREDPVS